MSLRTVCYLDRRLKDFVSGWPGETKFASFRTIYRIVRMFLSRGLCTSTEEGFRMHRLLVHLAVFAVTITFGLTTFAQDAPPAPAPVPTPAPVPAPAPSTGEMKEPGEKGMQGDKHRGRAERKAERERRRAERKAEKEKRKAEKKARKQGHDKDKGGDKEGDQDKKDRKD